MSDEPGADEHVDAAGGTDVDPVTLEVLRNAASAVAEEMNATLLRTAYSPNITDRRDCSCAIFDPDGGMIAQAENIPVHLGAMPFSVAAALEEHPPETLEPGDGIAVNDPFRGGAHLPDVTLVTPVFHDGALVAFAANRAHHADVGGATAGSVSAESTEIYAEGIRVPPVRLLKGGAFDDDLLATILANVRTPEERRGDLRAQAAANDVGRERIGDLIAEHGAAGFAEAVDAIQDYSERRMRNAIADLPDGEYAFADVLDDDGHGTDDVRIEATVTIDGETLAVDFAGTAEQTESPINAVRAVTASATYYAVRCVTDPEIPPNAGCYRPVELRTPSGTVVDAESPAAVVGGNLEVSQRVTDVVLGALAAVAPERAVAAGQGTMNNVTLGGTDPRDGSAYAFYETQGGGSGAHAAGDGMDAVHVHMSNTRNTPAEVLETAYPLAIERYELLADSGGAGEFRGGLGLRRDIRVERGAAQLSLLGDRREHAPYGIEGGDGGSPGTDVLLESSDAEGVVGRSSEVLPSKCTRRLDAGDVISIRTPGGGGFGDPADRDPESVVRDVRLGKCSPERARDVYGVDPGE
ncbi:N-methylhydantoinase B/acetone carboxylase, alpha subunit [Salinarchaeum sp. Harcht-Bsk1]|uniref:hydantoinase B/oxoprolinase family protein n=1 Tax=Salinarchaeum sp. Harcht-Bsk1 TaxID=1333523 RepID=UPI0003422ADC|nr:hydantoinase B/oxoprolinase family protein [Salinarchaeum sp. Harcht-Bsk1]AGN01901.1 N-methylhydantoinase B/acetone carboxylase, alpha subunit [Salinarchaeum sp. Harcht-Bsk1]